MKAATFAAKRHTDQRRKGANAPPYINHPLEVASMLADIGKVQDYDVLIAAILHDTVEDVGVTLDEITELFGGTVSGYVAEVSDDKSLPKPERKRLQVEHAPHLSPGAKLIKLADKVSNVREVTDHPPHHWDLKRRQEYIQWGRNVVAGLRGVNPALEQLFDDVAAQADVKLGKAGA